MIKYGTNCSPTLVGVSGNPKKFKKYKAGIVSNLTSIMANWKGTADLWLPTVLNCGTSTVKDVNGEYTEVFEITKDAHQSQTIRKKSYTHYQLEATSTTGWLNNRKIHVYTSRATGTHAIISFDYGHGNSGTRYIYEDVTGQTVQHMGLTFNMEYL